MSCCRRIVQLCRDCLLIVYQFAADAKAAGAGSVLYQTATPHDGDTRYSITEQNGHGGHSNIQMGFLLPILFLTTFFKKRKEPHVCNGIFPYS